MVLTTLVKDVVYPFVQNHRTDIVDVLHRENFSIFSSCDVPDYVVDRQEGVVGPRLASQGLFGLQIDKCRGEETYKKHREREARAFVFFVGVLTWVGLINSLQFS